MHDSLILSAGALYAFLLVLARVSGVLIFVPIPGVKGVPEPVRAAFVLAFTLALQSRWPQVDAVNVTPGKLVGWAAAEASLGMVIGVAIAVTLEAFTLAAQVLGLQAGYAYASTIDPNTEADSGILLVFAQLVAGLLFFSVGLDRRILRLFAESLDMVPAGSYAAGPVAAESLIRLASGLFSIGVRLALPVVALLVMVDVALALLGRLNSQLQLLSVAFPLKMLTALVILSWMAALYPRILLESSGRTWTAVHQALGK